MHNNQTITPEYWEEFSIKPSDIDFIYNFLLEKEIPQSTMTLLEALIDFRIVNEKESKEKLADGKEKVYLPKENFQVGDRLIFPSMKGRIGDVIDFREGFNPDIEGLNVIQVKFDDDNVKMFACNITEHQLNHIFDIPDDDPNYDPASIINAYDQSLSSVLEASLEANEDLVKIAGYWFPRSLLIDVNMGHLNLAEAVLEEANGGPLSTSDLMQQVELSANVDNKLLEFSFDLALQEDERFDEVGPAGKTQWFLHEMEPESVRKTPIFLESNVNSVSDEAISNLLENFEASIFDELEKYDAHQVENDTAVISLSYPHWRAGTLPLSNTLSKMFPTAYEAPRVKFDFNDGDDQFSGWVVRKEKYVFGLDSWYKKNDIIPGSLIFIKKGKKPGEISISFEKSRQNKEWIKTVLVGSDDGIVIAMLKQPINADFNERMALVVTDVDALDEIWKKQVYKKEPIEKTIKKIMRELVKLNPQGQVHAQELYASVNVVRRCPPSALLQVLLNDSSIEYLGDLYFKNKEKGV